MAGAGAKTSRFRRGSKARSPNFGSSQPMLPARTTRTPRPTTKLAPTARHGMVISRQPSLFKKHKGAEYFEVPAGHGDSNALLETTRRWSFHGRGRGRRPSAFLCGTPFGYGDESGDPDQCFRESRRHPRAPSELLPKKRKSKGRKRKVGKKKRKNRPAA